MSTLVMLMSQETGPDTLQESGLPWLAQTTDGVIHTDAATKRGKTVYRVEKYKLAEAKPDAPTNMSADQNNFALKNKFILARKSIRTSLVKQNV